MINPKQFKILAAAVKWRRPSKIYQLAGIDWDTKSRGAPLIYQLVTTGHLQRASRDGVPTSGSGRHIRLYRATKKGRKALEEFYNHAREIAKTQPSWREV